MLMFDKAIVNGAGGRAKRVAALVGAVIALVVPLSVLAGASEQSGELVTTAMQPKAGTGTIETVHSGYELRCWQKGRLILHEHFVQPPPESSADALRMTDGAGRPVRVLETTNATCLLKAVPTPPRVLRP